MNVDSSQPDPANQPNNVLAIVGLVLAFIIPLIGLVLSIIGLRKAKQLSGRGRTPAIVGIVISITGIIVQIMLATVITLVVVAYQRAQERDEARLEGITSLATDLRTHLDQNQPPTQILIGDPTAETFDFPANYLVVDSNYFVDTAINPVGLLPAGAKSGEILLASSLPAGDIYQGCPDSCQLLGTTDSVATPGPVANLPNRSNEIDFEGILQENYDILVVSQASCQNDSRLVSQAGAMAIIFALEVGDNASTQCRAV